MGTKFDEMKVALVIDDLIVRDAAIGLFEEIIGLFPNSTIYTYSHQVGAILGPVEQRKVQSTYLSNKIKKMDDWKKYQFLISNAKEQLIIPCSYDLCFKFSRGLGHLIPVCTGVPVLTYLFDDSRFKLKKDLFRQKIFSAMVSNLVNRGLNESKNVIFASESLKKRYQPNSDAQVIRPGVNRKEFKAFPDALIKSMGGRTLTLVDTTDLSDFKELDFLARKLKSESIDYHLIGPEEKNEVFVNRGFDPKRIIGNKCAGELTPLFQRARVVLSFARTSFPEIALQGRSSGAAVVQIGQHQCFQDLIEDAGTISLSLEEAIIPQQFDKKELGDDEINIDDWKKEMFIAINKLTINKKKLEHVSH